MTKWLLLFFYSCAVATAPPAHVIPMPDWPTCDHARRAIEIEEGHLQAWAAVAAICRPDRPEARHAGREWEGYCEGP